MQLRHLTAMLIALAAGCAAAGCGGGSGSSPADAFPYATQPPAGTTTATLTSSPQTAPLPATAGYTGSIALPSVTTGAGTNVALFAGISPPNGVPVISPTQTASQPAPIPLIYVALTPAATVTLASLPGLAVTLPANISTATTFSLALLDPAKPLAGYVLGTEGPAVAAGSTVTLTPPSGAVTLQGGATYTFSLYGVPAPTPSPSPSPSP